MHTVATVDCIRKNETGEIRTRLGYLPVFPPDTEPHLFIWEDGNYSCDCNRELFFERIAGNDDADVQCSDGRFSVVILDAETGYQYISEFDLPDTEAMKLIEAQLKC